jgi:hypothetical protein
MVVDLAVVGGGCVFIFRGICESSVVVPVKPKVKKERDLYSCTDGTTEKRRRNKRERERERERESVYGYRFQTSREETCPSTSQQHCSLLLLHV